MVESKYVICTRLFRRAAARKAHYRQIEASPPEMDWSLNVIPFSGRLGKFHVIGSGHFIFINSIFSNDGLFILL